ncbi:hypothetical protein LEP1GSC133_4842 [Leptospira borgpetersenii serovar Pomona str. 200901868]|uniref:Uncharacterized protein n=1 Tax=Leptospira borgpetersenii serovar Pomona str. 200901868 TaxID=1192866 RepID=M6W6G4_LEPBO|nr:hypothetical protein LEP1GSC133_4842 [Leptospira borgpetersenii serovar Pomona str. 200901868]
MVILRIENFAILRERNKPKIAERNFWLFSELRISRSLESEINQK